MRHSQGEREDEVAACSGAAKFLFFKAVSTLNLDAPITELEGSFAAHRLHTLEHRGEEYQHTTLSVCKARAEHGGCCRARRWVG